MWFNYMTASLGSAVTTLGWLVGLLFQVDRRGPVDDVLFD